MWKYENVKISSVLQLALKQFSHFYGGELLLAG
jgi:hypothetical protein